MSDALSCLCAPFGGACFECGTRHARWHSMLNPQNRRHECLCSRCLAHVRRRADIVADDEGVVELYDGC